MKLKITRKCEICGEKVKYLTRHLKNKHNDITEKDYYDKYNKQSDKEGYCLTCGEPLKFNNVYIGYQKYCDSSCEMKDKTIQDKIKTTYYIKTGYRHNFKNPEVKKQIKETQNKLYGGYGFGSKKIREKALETYNKTNNTEYKSFSNMSNTEETKEKIKNTRKEKYGEYCSPKTKEVLKQHNETFYKNLEKVKQRTNNRIKKYGSYISEKQKLNNKNQTIETYKKYNIIVKDVFFKDNQKMFKCHCDICNEDYNIIQNTLRTRYYSEQTLCTKCNPLNSNNYIVSNLEKELFNYIKEIYNKEIISNDRTILNGKELDIVIPDKKIAIEFDGLYWHNEEYKDDTFHVNKTNECEEKGYQLIHVFEDEWIYKTDIVKSRIKGLLGLNERIYARKCEYKEITFSECKKFLENNHIQGNCNSEYRYGLYYNNELVSIMTFGKSRFNKNEYEMLRFCNKLNTNVIGGASKLFNHFIKEHSEIKEIISYADRRWSIGNLYEKLNLHKEGNTHISYYYIIDGQRYNRMNYTKAKLVAEGYDSNKTEHQIMLERKIYRIYDCGTIKYKWTKKVIYK